MATLSQLEAMQAYFESGITKTSTFRQEQLKKLKRCIEKYEEDIYAALYSDLKKSKEECWVTETGIVLSELKLALKNLKLWMTREQVKTNLLNVPSSSFILKEPLGVVLIIGPWNYPFQLLLNPLVGAIAAGNCAVLKPSEFAPATAAVMKKIVEETFDKKYVLYAEGDGAAVIPAMMNHFRFDHVFYTGSTSTGKIIYKMAAEKLVPVTLELGGKSPCIVEADANIKVAARRIAITSFSNCGQMCVAPDYILVHQSKKAELIDALKRSLQDFFGSRPQEHENYGKIINEKQFDRLVKFLSEGTIAHGGGYDKAALFIEPTILDNIQTGGAVMKEEIFGPILPVLSFTTKEEALKIIANNKNPLAFYVFTSSATKEKEWLEKVAFGGGCVNNASWHLTNHHLPFGGRGFSGTGQYHGKATFDLFTHRKSVMKTPTWFDPAMKYPPFKGKLKLFKWILG
ncbi:MAG TPA: aldehyde dehydrogenase [Ferruginibacter sp.]|nr:aldehyde dehydrogenase [Ferruginibacter sp.]